MDVAKAGRICVVEAEEIVEPGDIPPDEIHLPGIYVHRIVEARLGRIKPFEFLVTADKFRDVKENAKTKIARRAATEITEGMYVNLGIGIPTLASL